MELIYKFKKGAKIHIKEKNKGSFTKWCGGNVTNECIQRGKNSSNPKIRKKATFADNARRWKHKDGGILKGLEGLKTLIQINENQQRNSPFTYTLILRLFVPKTRDTHETELFPGKEVVIRGTDRSKQEKPYFVSSQTKLLQPSEAMYPLEVLAKPLTYIPGFNYIAPALSAGNYAAALTQGSLNPYKGAEIRANNERLLGAWLPLDFAGPAMLGKGFNAGVLTAARAGNNAAREFLFSRELGSNVRSPLYGGQATTYTEPFALSLFWLRPGIDGNRLSLKFFERRPSRISERERKGFSKGEEYYTKELNESFLKQINDFAEKYGYTGLKEGNYTSEQLNAYARALIDRHNKFYRGVVVPSGEDLNLAKKALGNNATDELILKHVATHSRGEDINPELYITPTPNAFSYGANGKTAIISRPYKLGKDRTKWFDEGDFDIVETGTVNPKSYNDFLGLVYPWSSPRFLTYDPFLGKKIIPEYYRLLTPLQIIEGEGYYEYVPNPHVQNELISINSPMIFRLWVEHPTLETLSKKTPNVPWQLSKITVNKQGGSIKLANARHFKHEDGGILKGQESKMKKFQLGGFVNPAMAAIPYMNPNSMGGSIVQGYFNNLLNLDLILQMQQQKKLAELEEKKLKMQQQSLMFNTLTNLGGTLLTTYLNNRLSKNAPTILQDVNSLKT